MLKANKLRRILNRFTTPVKETKQFTGTTDLLGEYRTQFQNRLDRVDRVRRAMGGDVDAQAALQEARLMEQGLLEDTEVPEDTYSNIEDPEALEASQLSDDATEEEYFTHVIERVLEPAEIEYLEQALNTDKNLEEIIEKLIVSSAEFSGEGSVEGPGTGVSDSIPARLSDGEFVFTEKATDQLGPENLQVLMDDAERAADGGLMQKKYAGSNRIEGKAGLKSQIDKLMLLSSPNIQ